MASVPAKNRSLAAGIGDQAARRADAGAMWDGKGQTLLTENVMRSGTRRSSLANLNWTATNLVPRCKVCASRARGPTRQPASSAFSSPSMMRAGSAGLPKVRRARWSSMV